VPNNADRIVEMLLRAGVQRLFGMPGGGSNADVIEAAGRAGLPFSLAQTETGSAFMATAQAEITGKPGACIATLGPGAAAIMNGVANANLDCVPLIVITDCHSTAPDEVIQHQALRQGAMFAPLVKLTEKPSPTEVADALERLFAAALSAPPGPVHLDLSSEATSATAPRELSLNHSHLPTRRDTGPLPSNAVESLRAARRPVFLIGLGARGGPVAGVIRAMCEGFGIPALVTYKAKGVVPDRNSWFAGVLTNGALEREVLEQADTLVAVGLDPVELLPRPWAFPQPLISVTAWPMQRRQIPGAIELVGHVGSILDEIAALLRITEWEKPEIGRMAEEQRERMRPEGEGHGLRPHRVVELTAEVYAGARATVDAGAHMFPVMSLWPAEEPSGVLISNGLATMGFALPAAIGAALLDRSSGKSKPVVAFTGDGGLLMCLGELRTAAREALPLRIIVFDDTELSLIRIKQVQRGYRTDSMAMGEVDWRSVGKGLGLLAVTADSETSLRDMLRETLNHKGPVLIAAKIDPSTYPELIRALRG
jgi:acetolactate synthase-1/2/3 large subunit